ncbi:MAG: hypothetical protein C4532_07370 [Candidatus Abyssobacteria bacterium SURF_17]|uniref:Uncharacterized protein n=1 Tax=Candidatus Abyssobacteria bacterium SURF_17 TaxID=2093361 RepID=A0A419F0S0_9BACT|nr:MAG: hypothetical protein C4532_07370 [Candidatus Abyssubacteria bacterium SURF_17]
MRSIYSIMALCLVAILVTTIPAIAQECPEPGSGAVGVAEFSEGCIDCVDGPVVTCNGEFRVNLMNFERDTVLRLATFTYRVYNFPEATDSGDLVHWVLGIDMEQFQTALANDMTLEDLFVSCSVNGLAVGMDCGLVLPDPTTQLDGVKFEAVIGDSEYETFSITLDEAALIHGFEVAKDCALAATKAGDQDIQRVDRLVPGYACINGPVLAGEPLPYVCPRSQGFWKNHAEAWPVTSLVLGSETYSQSELITILRTPPRGDASLILAKQLIAAKLNVENGSDPAPIDDTIESADDQLSAYSGKLPYGVRTYTSAGHAMLQDAQILDNYNNRELTPDCEG